MLRKTIKIVLSFLLFLSASCVKFPEKPDPEEKEESQPAYIYPFNNENKNIIAEITIQTDGTTDLNTIDPEIPYLKYNKSLLFFLTQDDCPQSAYSSTWAAINGKPLSRELFYDAPHLKAGDLPIDILYLGKTLGYSDGAGNEVRFSFTTTLAPESKWMDAEADVNIGFKENYYRFYKKSGLIWDNVIEILNYGNGIAFHNVNTIHENNIDTILNHYSKSQKIIQDRLSGRGCKTLAEPDGNKSYVIAAQNYSPIQTMTAQAEALTLYPFKVNSDLQKELLGRVFYSIEEVKDAILTQLTKRKEDRTAIHWGVHGTDYSVAKVLQWINDNYGKDGNDSVWFPCMEEYYEYNYYRIHGSVKKSVSSNTIKLIVNLPSNQYFYFPSITINLPKLKAENISSLTSTDQITGLSYANYDGGVMINIDCRKFLLEHATHFVESYEDKKTNSNREDALYFTGMLKDSDNKADLLKRIK